MNFRRQIEEQRRRRLAAKTRTVEGAAVEGVKRGVLVSDEGDDDTDAKVIPFAPTATPSLRVDRSFDPHPCRHINVEIREGPRRLRCADC